VRIRRDPRLLPVRADLKHFAIIGRSGGLLKVRAER
jgi:hypothetical protein